MTDRFKPIPHIIKIRTTKVLVSRIYAWGVKRGTSEQSYKKAMQVAEIRFPNGVPEEIIGYITRREEVK